MDLAPKEDKSGAGISIELLRFTRVIVGVKDESAAIELLEENDARGRDAFWRGGGERHGLGLLDMLVEDGVLEPALELSERAGVDSVGRQLVLGDVLDVREDLDFVGQDGDVHERNLARAYMRQLPTPAFARHAPFHIRPHHLLQENFRRCPSKARRRIHNCRRQENVSLCEHPFPAFMLHPHAFLPREAAWCLKGE